MKIFKYVILGAILMALFACENEKNTFSDNPSIYIGDDKEQCNGRLRYLLVQKI